MGAHTTRCYNLSLGDECPVFLYLLSVNFLHNIKIRERDLIKFIWMNLGLTWINMEMRITTHIERLPARCRQTKDEPYRRLSTRHCLCSRCPPRTRSRAQHTVGAQGQYQQCTVGTQYSLTLNLWGGGPTS